MISIALNLVSRAIAGVRRKISKGWTDGNGNTMTDGNGNYIVLKDKE